VSGHISGALVLSEMHWFFQDDVDAFMASEENGGDVDKVLRRLDEQHSKYKFMEYSLASKKRR
jgi:hypothetical protein